MFGKNTKLTITKVSKKGHVLEMKKENDTDRNRAIIGFELERIKEEEGIIFKEGDEIYLKDIGNEYEIIYLDGLIGKVEKIKFYGTSNM